MGSMWFLKLALKCIDLLAWPLLALGYPLCASVEAIETDSFADARNLLSYWILLSLIYLFEFAFLKLLQWFQYWPYIKLVMIFWLIIPDFGRASYVYNHLVHLCISMNPHLVIRSFKSWRELFVNKEYFLLQAEKYIKENGTEALEKLIASKGTTRNLEAEAVKAVPATAKKEMQQVNVKSFHIEQKDVQDLWVIEKEEVPAIKQGNPTALNLAMNENTSSVITETKGILGKDEVCGKLPQISAGKKVQKEWTCAICQVTTQSEPLLNSHLHGKKHRDTCEALKATNQPIPMKFVPVSMVKEIDQSNKKSEKIVSADALKQEHSINQHADREQNNSHIANIKEHAKPNKELQKSMLGDALKHRKIKYQENKSQWQQKGVHAPANKTDQLNAKNEESIFNNGLKWKNIHRL